MAKPDIMAHIDANARDFHTAMKKVRGDSQLTGRAFDRDVAQMSAKLRGFGSGLGALAGGPAGLAAALGLGAVVELSRASVDGILQLGAAAKSAGVSFEAFQELKFAAEANLVSVNALGDGLKEMQLRADEFIKTGGGPAAESLKRIGLSASELALRLKEPDKLFEEIINRVKTLDQAAQIRVMDELFGGSAGEQFVRFLDESKAGIAQLRAEGREFGVVMDQEFLTKAEDVNKAWDKMSVYVGTNVKMAVVSVLNELITYLQMLNEINAAWQITARNYGEAIGAATGLNKIGPALDRYMNAMGGMQNALGQSGSEVRTTAKSAKPALQPIAERFGGEPSFEPIVAAPKLPAVRRGGGGGSRAASIKEVKEEKNAIEEIIKALKEERELIGLSDSQREKVLALRKAGAKATEKEKAMIEQMIDAKNRETDAYKRQQEEIKKTRDIQEEFLSRSADLINSVIDGTFEWTDAVKQLGQELVRSALTGQGFFASLFSGIGGGSGGGGGFLSSILGFVGGLFGFGGGAPSGLSFGGPRAAGGNVSASRFYEVNEKGKEIFSPGQSGTIYPAGFGRDFGGRFGGGQGKTVIQVMLSPDLEARILEQAANQSVQVTQEGAKIANETAPRRAPSANYEAKRRGL